MYYISWEYSITGWIFAGVFFVFLAGYFWGERQARKRQAPGFDVLPIKESDEKQS